MSKEASIQFYEELIVIHDRTLRRLVKQQQLITTAITSIGEDLIEERAALAALKEE